MRGGKRYLTRGVYGVGGIIDEFQYPDEVGELET
jgi:hypothetical protein